MKVGKSMESHIFRTVHHVCIVVHDIEKSMAYYESLGIGPWQHYPPFDGFTLLEKIRAEKQLSDTLRPEMHGVLKEFKEIS